MYVYDYTVLDLRYSADASFELNSLISQKKYLWKIREFFSD